MYDKEDFFSPEMVDERLDLSLLQHGSDTPGQDVSGVDPNLLLISDLRYLYGAEGTENVRSLQRVWEHLQEPRARDGTIPARAFPEGGPERHLPQDETISARVLPLAGSERHLRLLKSSEEMSDSSAKASNKRMFFAGMSNNAGKVSNKYVYNRGLAALAAMLFLVVMVGSLLMVVRLTRGAQADVQATTTSSAVLTPQPTLVPGYLYAPPGNTLAISPASSEAFYALAWSPDGKQLATSTQGKIWLWDVASNHYRVLLNARLAGGSVKALAWSPDGRFLAVGSNPIEIVDPLGGKVVETVSADYPYLPVSGQTTLVTALAWSPDGTMLAVATQHVRSTAWVFVWNMQTGTGIYTFTQQGASSVISAVSWSDDSRYVASTDAQTVQAWDIRNGYVIFEQTLDAATNVAWSPNGGLLAFAYKHTTQIWNVWQGSNKAGKLVSSYPATNGVLSWSPKGQYLATASGNTVIIFDASSGARIYTYAGGTQYVSTLAWSPTGDYLASGESSSSGSNFARIWSA
jgi:WD40 repeat protein